MIMDIFFTVVFVTVVNVSALRASNSCDFVKATSK